MYLCFVYVFYARLCILIMDGDSLESACSFVHMIDDNLKLLLGVYQKELSLWMAKFQASDIHVCETM